MLPQLTDVQQAHQRIRSSIHETPVFTSATLDARTGGQVFFKCENFQKIGAFKIRGGCNTVFSLGEEEAARGVVTHSSGNHAAAVALAAKLRNIPARIVMPENSTEVKIAAVRGYGGEITFCASHPAAREETALRIVEETGAVLIPSYNDPRVICGQGTAALELMEQIGDLDIIMTPLGGGGLLSGTAIAAKGLDPGICVIGVEPEQVDDAYQSLKTGMIVTIDKPVSIAEGLLMPLREHTFPVIRKFVSEILLVSEEEIVEAMRFVYERMKMIIEPSSAVVPAAILSGKIDIKGKRVGAIISGGNVDMGVFFQWMHDKGNRIP
ncbi:pyridoxal-phosphate dependent enzyme [bacterium]|nr:pyridoxal-phosphate dependent enzyme [bacterium]